MEVVKKASHRNGVAGEPFRVAIVDDTEVGDKMLVVMFPTSGHTAVFSLDLLSQGIIEFGENSWRGDRYEGKLRNELYPNEDDNTSAENNTMSLGSYKDFFSQIMKVTTP